jgi:hypothetical protein
MTQTTFTTAQINSAKIIADNKCNSTSNLVAASDCANLMFEGFDTNTGAKLFRLYKSFDKNFMPIVAISYCYVD